MDTDLEQGQSSVFSTLNVGDEARGQLLEMAKWTKFLAIINFIGIGIMVIGGIAAGLALSRMDSAQLGPFAMLGGTGIVLFYLLIAATLFYPFYAMLRYAVSIRKALHSNDEGQFVFAIRSLKRVFKYVGIITIIGFAIWVTIFVIAMIGVAMR